MRAFDTYRHISTLDVDIFIHRITYYDAKRRILKVSFVNRHNGIVYNNIPEKITIYAKDFRKWKRVG